MHAIELSEPNIAALARITCAAPASPSRGQALVRMRAAALNFLDLLVATGRYPGAIYPNAPVADGAGEVVAVGGDVDEVAVGDRVAVHPKTRWIAGRGTAKTAEIMRGVTVTGSLVEYALVEAATLVKAPDHLSWEEIACLPVPATTGWNALVAAGVGPGSTVVIPGTGVTALQTLQLAKAAGATVIITSSSDQKLAWARALGADHGINYRAAPDWDREVMRLTNGRGADLILETTGEATFAKSLSAVCQGGTVFTIGFVSGASVQFELLPIIVKAVQVIGSNTGSVADLRSAMEIVAAHRIRPLIGQTFSVRDVASAYRALEEAERFGKVAITLDW